MKPCKNFIKLFVIIFLFLFNKYTYAQDVGTSVANLSQDIATSYLAPISLGYGTSMNSGWVTKIPLGNKVSFDIEVGFVFMGAFMGNTDKTFSKPAKIRLSTKEADILTQQYNNNPPLKNAIMKSLTSDYVNVLAHGPTITGSIRDSLKVDFSGRYVNVSGYNYYVPGKTLVYPVVGILDDVKFLILFTPQMTVGTLMGTHLTLRYIPNFMFGQANLNSTYYFGVGLQHNPFAWFKGKVPFEMSVAGSYQRLNVENVVRTHEFRTGLYFGKTFGKKLINFNIYAGANYEYSKIYVDYNYTREGYTVPISFTMMGENKFRGTIGCGVKLIAIGFNADVNIAKMSAISFGIRAGF